MKLTLKRDVFSDKFTLGTLSVNGKHLGFTCEDTDRHIEDDKDGDGNPIDKGEKIYGQTAIPKGTYPVTLSFSHRFQKIMPEVLNVPNFSGVRIHGGNRADNTLGCPLLGSTRLGDGVANCAGVNKRLIELIQLAEDHGEEVTLEVV
jgi:hypothetical protein